METGVGTLIYMAPDSKSIWNWRWCLLIFNHDLWDCYWKFTIWWKCDFLSLSIIEKESFSNTSTEEIIIPKSVTQIQKSAFISCKKLSQVVIEEGSKLISFSSEIFFSCKKLTTVKIPQNSSLKTIYDYAFFDTPIKSIFIPSSLIELKHKWCCFTP